MFGSLLGESPWTNLVEVQVSEDVPAVADVLKPEYKDAYSNYIARSIILSPNFVAAATCRSSVTTAVNADSDPRLFAGER